MYDELQALHAKYGDYVRVGETSRLYESAGEWR